MNKQKIVVVGAGKMGAAFMDAAENQGYEILGVYDLNSYRNGRGRSVTDIAGLDKDLSEYLGRDTSTVIVDFTLPDAFMKNIDTYLEHRLPVVVGTTGWFADKEKLQLVTDKVNKAGTGLIYAGNFSLGVQVTYLLTDLASKLLGQIGGFDASIIEEHHTNKADSPSGTAAEMGKIIMKNMNWKTEVVNGNSEGKIRPEQLQISAIRRSKVFGTHIVDFEDANQRIEISHRSDSREHFAQGAIKAVDFIRGKKGVYNTQDLVKSLFAEHVK